VYAVFIILAPDWVHLELYIDWCKCTRNILPFTVLSQFSSSSEIFRMFGKAAILNALVSAVSAGAFYVSIATSLSLTYI
jgi:hypothetical protein